MTGTSALHCIILTAVIMGLKNVQLPSTYLMSKEKSIAVKSTHNTVFY